MNSFNQILHDLASLVPSNNIKCLIQCIADQIVKLMKNTLFANDIEKIKLEDIQFHEKIYSNIKEYSEKIIYNIT